MPAHPGRQHSKFRSDSFNSNQNQIKSNQTQIYNAPYIANESEALGLGLDRIG